MVAVGLTKVTSLGHRWDVPDYLGLDVVERKAKVALVCAGWVEEQEEGWGLRWAELRQEPQPVMVSRSDLGGHMLALNAFTLILKLVISSGSREWGRAKH